MPNLTPEKIQKAMRYTHMQHSSTPFAEFQYYATLAALQDDSQQTPISSEDYPIHCNQSGAFIRNFSMTTEIAPLVEIHGIVKARDILAYLATTYTLPHWLYQTADTIPNASIMYPREHVVFAFSRIYYHDKQEHEFHSDKQAAYAALQTCNYELIRALNVALIAYLSEVNCGRYPNAPIFAPTMQSACTDDNIAKIIIWLNLECEKVKAKDAKLVLSESYQNYVARGTGIYKTAKAITKKKLSKNANDFFDDLELGDMQHAFGCKTGKRVSINNPLPMVATAATVARYEKKNNAKGGVVLFGNASGKAKITKVTI